ncbi:MAG: helix-turn-helix domain-containing protein [Myxococcales bacterium]
MTRGAATGRGRPPVRASAGGGALANIADHVLGMRLPHPMEAIEVALLSQAMTDASGNITAAARLLGIHRKAVERKLVKHRLSNRSATKPKTTKRTTRRKPARRRARR